MTDGRTAPKPISPFHFVAGDNKTSWRERTETKCNIYQMTTWMNHINHTWITYLNKSYFFQNNFKIFSKSHNDQQYAMFYFWLAYPCMFQRCCIVSVMFKYIFLQFSYVNIQFFVIFQKIGVISLIKISDMKDMLFLHSYDLIKDKQPKNSLKQTFFFFLLHCVILKTDTEKGRHHRTMT